MTTKIAVRISANDMARLVAASHADPIDGFVEMWRTIEPEWDDLDEVTPWHYELTKEQSTELTEAGLKGCRDNAIDTWTIMSLWLNNGPSTAAD